GSSSYSRPTADSSVTTIIPTVPVVSSHTYIFFLLFAIVAITNSFFISAIPFPPLYSGSNSYTPTISFLQLLPTSYVFDTGSSASVILSSLLTIFVTNKVNNIIRCVRAMYYFFFLVPSLSIYIPPHQVSVCSVSWQVGIQWSLMVIAGLVTEEEEEEEEEE